MRVCSPRHQKIVIWDSDLVCLQNHYWLQPLAQTWCPLTMGWGQKNEALLYKPITCRLLHNSTYTFTAWADYGISSHLGRDSHIAPQDTMHLTWLKTKPVCEYRFLFAKWWNVHSCFFPFQVEVFLWWKREDGAATINDQPRLQRCWPSSNILNLSVGRLGALH